MTEDEEAELLSFTGKTIDGMGDGVLALDEKCDIVIYNGAALGVLDLNINLMGKNISGVMHLIDKNNQKKDIKQIILNASTQSSNRDLRLVYANGDKINLFISIAPVRLSYGKSGSKGYVVLLRDITREKSLEEERDEFISVVSHELRTPIAIAEGNVSNAEFIVEKQGSMEQVKHALKTAHEQIIFLSGLINDLSTLSRAERGVLKIEVESINAHQLISEIRDEYTEQANKKGLKIITDIDPKLHILKSSKLYLREILQNLVTNAIKYTQGGQVTLRVEQADNGILFEVEDTGIGINPGDQEKIFDKFFRSEDFRTRANSGTGLGLYVTMKLVRLIHAELRLKSEINKGSIFMLAVPNL